MLANMASQKAEVFGAGNNKNLHEIAAKVHTEAADAARAAGHAREAKNHESKAAEHQNMANDIARDEQGRFVSK